MLCCSDFLPLLCICSSVKGHIMDKRGGLGWISQHSPALRNSLCEETVVCKKWTTRSELTPFRQCVINERELGVIWCIWSWWNIYLVNPFVYSVASQLFIQGLKWHKLTLHNPAKGYKTPISETISLNRNQNMCFSPIILMHPFIGFL